MVTRPSLGGLTSMMTYMVPLMTTCMPGEGQVGCLCRASLRLLLLRALTSSPKAGMPRAPHVFGSDHIVALPSTAGGGTGQPPGAHCSAETAKVYLSVYTDAFAPTVLTMTFHVLLPSGRLLEPMGSADESGAMPETR